MEGYTFIKECDNTLELLINNKEFHTKSALNESQQILTHSIWKHNLTVKVVEYGNDEIADITKGINIYVGWIKGVVNNIEEVSAEREYLANYDPLTKLVNRSLLFHRLTHLSNQLHRYSRYHAILHIDLDFFKKLTVNMVMLLAIKYYKHSPTDQ